MSKRILITGSAGFIGSHFVEHLVKNTDWHIVGLDSFKHRGDSERTRHIPHDRYDVFCHDLNSPVSKRTLHLLGKIDFVVNVASESHVDRSIADPVGFTQNNVNLALHVFEMCRELKPQKIIQVSTDEIYGAAYGDYKHKEEDRWVPSNPYSASKAAQNAIAMAYWRTYNLPIMITNAMNNFAERQDGEKFIPKCISKIMKGETITIHGSQENPGKRTYLHARNLSDAWLFLLQKIEPKMYDASANETQAPEIYNVAGDEEVDNYTLAITIADILDKHLHYQFVDFEHARPGHDKKYALEGSKLKNLGWTPPMDFQSSLQKTILWTKDHPEWLI